MQRRWDRVPTEQFLYRCHYVVVRCVCLGLCIPRAVSPTCTLQWRPKQTADRARWRQRSFGRKMTSVFDAPLNPNKQTGGDRGSRRASLSVLLFARRVSTACETENPRAQQSSVRALVFPDTRRLSGRPAPQIILFESHEHSAHRGGVIPAGKRRCLTTRRRVSFRRS